ncbi:MAG: 30S ribosomal protein S1 [Alphaproteobacteria bacterium]|nr:30S ribosomal protein S1 [Alphaproteobacteria bacterium]
MSNIDLDINLADISRENFEAFFDEFLGERNIKEQSVVQGTVIRIEGDWVMVDVGYKAEGRIRLSEFSSPEGGVEIAQGDTVDVYLDSMDEEHGELRLSKEKADLMKAWDEVAKAVEADKTVTGVIVARVKGGLSVDIGVKAFLPGSQVDLRPVKNLDKLIGESFEFKIIKFNKKRGNIVLSRRVLLEKDREAKRRKTIEKLQPGVIMNGVVKNITDYGAFVDLGGIDGLLHITDMAYGRINHPSEMFEVGQSIEVKVLKFDPDSQRVSLGYKQIRPDPWEEADYKYPVGSIVRGKVVSIPDYGAFIELEDGIEGLVHISEMTWNKRVKHPSKLVAIGDIVEAKVLGIDMENKRISLGMRQLEENPWDRIEERYPVGTVVQGKVRNITDFGIFVGIEDGIDGLVHISDLSWGQRVRHPGERFKKGDEVEARVLNIDKENERFSLGIKQLSDDPWLSVHGRYFIGQPVEGPVVHQADFGIFIELEDGVEGLAHISELKNAAGDWQEEYPVGMKIKAIILNIDPYDRKISLSESAAGEDDGVASDYAARQQQSGARLGDIMGDIASRISDD